MLRGERDQNSTGPVDDGLTFDNRKPSSARRIGRFAKKGYDSPVVQSQNRAAVTTPRGHHGAPLISIAAPSHWSKTGVTGESWSTERTERGLGGRIIMQTIEPFKACLRRLAIGDTLRRAEEPERFSQ